MPSDNSNGLVFLNPHATDFFATPVSFVMLRRRGLKKYGFLFDRMIEQKNPIAVLVDGTLSSLMPDRLFTYLPSPIRHIILRVELRLWTRINKLRGKVQVHYGSKGSPSGKALFLFSYKDCVGCFSRRQKLIESFPLALVHLSHYMIRTSEKARNLSKLSNVTLVGDSDISSNSYYKTHFGWYQKRLLILPFYVAPRFQMHTPLNKRKKRCIATGSFHVLTEEVPIKYYRDFMTHFENDTYHPVRKMIYENRRLNGDWLTCYISHYREHKNGSPSRVRRLLNYVLVRQRKYFSINMLAEYNDHRLAIIGEELSGFPALGAFEAMACGCVLLAGSQDYYRGLGLEPGRHYLLHDGTLAGIKEMVDKLTCDSNQLATIATEGRLYVDKFMRGSFAFDRLVEFIAGQCNEREYA